MGGVGGGQSGTMAQPSTLDRLAAGTGAFQKLGDAIKTFNDARNQSANIQTGVQAGVEGGAAGRVNPFAAPGAGPTPVGAGLATGFNPTLGDIYRAQGRPKLWIQ